MIQYGKYLHPLMNKVYEVNSVLENYRHEQIGARKIADYFNKTVVAAGNVGELQGVPAYDGVILDDKGGVLFNYSLKTPVLKKNTDSRNIISGINKAFASISKHSTIQTWVRSFHLFYINHQLVAPNQNSYWREKINQVTLVAGMLGISEKQEKKSLVIINLDTNRPLFSDGQFIYIESPKKNIHVDWIRDHIKRSKNVVGVLFLSNKQAVFIDENGVK